MGLILLSVPFFCFSQDSLMVNRHQLGINASKFLSFFNEQVNSLEMAYRYKLSHPYSLRSGLSFEQNTAEDGLLNASIKLGVDRYFKYSEKWKFYYGIDAYYSRDKLNSSNRRTTKFGGFLFIGFLLHLDEHFSFSTEPNFSILRVQFRDEESFNPEANRNWYEFRTGNIGHIQLNFHF